VSLTDRVLALMPPRLRTQLLKRREEVKFVLVGGTCYLITVVINYVLKLTVLENKPVTALTIATVIASVISYVLNREWSFRTRGGRRRHHEASLFFVFSAIAVGLTAVPLFVARYMFDLQVPSVSRPVQEVSDFVSGLIVGTLLGMVFRLWAFRRWVFPEENVRPGRERSFPPANTGVNGAPVDSAPINGAPVDGARVNGARVNGAAVGGAPVNGAVSMPTGVPPTGAPADPVGETRRPQ
jgi:putative flippase GtrA